MSVPTQTDPSAHTYTSTTSLTAAYSSSDASCAIEYSCLPSLGDIDLCAVGSLDSSTGVFQLATTDKSAYPPGTYSVSIKGSIENFASKSN